MEECAMPHTETKWLHQDMLLKVQSSVVYTSMNVGFGCVSCFLAALSTY